jgi:hypothetical protein
MRVAVSAFDHLRMTRALLWLFFLADLAGIAWAVRVLVKEARRHLAWHLDQRRARPLETRIDLVEQPERFSLRPAVGADVPVQRAPEPSIAVHRVPVAPD